MIKEALKVIENLNTKENTHNIRGCTSTCFIISVLYTIKLYYIRDVYIDYVLLWKYTILIYSTIVYMYIIYSLLATIFFAKNLRHIFYRFIKIV